MRRPSRWTDRLRRALREEEGSAALEFVFGGLILLVPVVYLVVALGQIQGQSLGVEAGARHIARAVSTAADAADAAARADRVLDTIVSQYGLDPSAVDVDVSCAQAAPTCPAAGATVLVTVRATVPLPLVPPVLGLDQLASVPVQASSAQKVSRFWGDG
ncbi:TadE family protein [Microbacterium sp. NPDC091313]